MTKDWGIVGCAYMAQEYCKALLAKGISPRVFSRDLTSKNVQSFQELFPQIEVQRISEIRDDVGNWLVCTNIESHEDVCSRLSGNVYCEKPFSHSPDYSVDRDITVLMNRRYYYWVSHVKQIIDSGKIEKVVAVVPEKSINALITQSIHTIDLLWYLVGEFQAATKIGRALPTYFAAAGNDVSLVINMNYGAHENFSLRFYGDSGVVYEAKPLESFSIANGMEVRQPDDEIPFRSYRPVVTALEHVPSDHKPGLSELLDDLIEGRHTRLPSLPEHRRIHEWMQENML